MEKYLRKVLLLIVCKVLLVDCQYFSIVGPKTLRIGSAYKVAVTSHSGEIQNVSVGIVGASFDGKNYSVFNKVSVAAQETKIAKFSVRTFE